MKRIFLVAVALGTLATCASAQNANFNWKHGSDRTSCADLQVTSDEYEIARAEQQITVTPSEASSLNLEGSRNGGVYVSGWDRPNYQITACKVGFGENDAQAQQVLAGVNVARNGSQVTTTGPDSKTWSVHYIVRVPKTANLTASTYNGPVSAHDVDGKLSLKSHNGPVSIRRCNGEISGETENGPVSYTGTSGNIMLSTVNGPVSIRLENSQWNGDLNASTHNGPVAFQVPDNFQSAFLIEGGNGPMSCSSSICDKANKVNERGNRRIEFGSSPHVKATTQNGPVAVSTLRGDT